MNQVIVIFADAFQVRPQALLDIHAVAVQRGLEVGMLQLDLVAKEGFVLAGAMLESGIQLRQAAQQLGFVEHQLVFPFLAPIHPVRADVLQLLAGVFPNRRQRAARLFEGAPAWLARRPSHCD